MSFLTEWVRGLVILVLLAGCLELLVPMGNMKKYVRLTMGLLVVLAVVRPIAGWLGGSVAIDVSAMMAAESPPNRLPSVAEIMTRAGEFRAKNQALAGAETRTRIADEARRAALRVAGVAEVRVNEVTLQTGDGEPRVAELTVTVIPGVKLGRVKPVEPVRAGGQPPATDHRAAGASPAPGAESQLADAVRREIAAALGINADPKLVQVLVAKGQEAQRR